MGCRKISYYKEQGALRVFSKKFGEVLKESTCVLENSSDYYPFGMQQPGRHGNSADYRYGFNGMEKDDEVAGEGNSYTTHFRQYDPRIGRFKSQDPAKAKYPGVSPYAAYMNNPITYVDTYGDTVKITYIHIGLDGVRDEHTVVIDDEKTIELVVGTFAECVYNCSSTECPLSDNEDFHVEYQFITKETVEGNVEIFNVVLTHDPDWWDEGEGEVWASGGVMLTSQNGGVEATKYKSESGGEMMEMDMLFKVLGLVGGNTGGGAITKGKIGQIKNIMEGLKKNTDGFQVGSDVVEGFQQTFNKPTSFTKKQQKGDTVRCRYGCGELKIKGAGPLHEYIEPAKGKEKVNYPKEN